MPSVPFEAPFVVTLPNGVVGEGSARTSVPYELKSDDTIDVPVDGIHVELVRVKFADDNVEMPVVGGLCHVLVERWGVDQEIRTTLHQSGHLDFYGGELYVSPVPERLKLLVGAGSPLNLSGEVRPSGTLEVTPIRGQSKVAGRPLPAAVSLIEAKEHIDAAKALIQKYINAEPEPDEFGLAVLEALLREVDSLGDRLDTIISTQTVPPEADRSLSVIEWIQRLLVVKEGLGALAEALHQVLRIFT